MKKKLINNFFVFIVVSCQISLVTVQALDKAKSPQEVKKREIKSNLIYQSLTIREKNTIKQSLSKGDCLLSKIDWEKGKKTFSGECIDKKMIDTIKNRQQYVF